MLRAVARPGVIVAGILALLAAAFLVVGILLPGTVEVRRTVEIGASPESVFPFVNDLEAWTEWTSWGEVDSQLDGPVAGTGARRVWDDPSLGSGSLTLVDVRPPARVEYIVEIEDAAIRFAGTISIEANGPGSVVSWTERADLGWNPVLGWTALTLDESQGRQLNESLQRLKRLVEGTDEAGSRPPP